MKTIAEVENERRRRVAAIDPKSTDYDATCASYGELYVPAEAGVVETDHGGYRQGFSGGMMVQVRLPDRHYVRLPDGELRICSR